jgi:hypothetical protein
VLQSTVQQAAKYEKFLNMNFEDMVSQSQDISIFDVNIIKNYLTIRDKVHLNLMKWNLVSILKLILLLAKIEIELV